MDTISKPNTWEIKFNPDTIAYNEHAPKERQVVFNGKIGESLFLKYIFVDMYWYDNE